MSGNAGEAWEETSKTARNNPGNPHGSFRNSTDSEVPYFAIIPPVILNGQVRSIEYFPCIRHVQFACFKNCFTLGRVKLDLHFLLLRYIGCCDNCPTGGVQVYNSKLGPAVRIRRHNSID